MANNGTPSFPAPVPPTRPLTVSKDESDQEIPSKPHTPLRKNGVQNNPAPPFGPQHDESLETLSIHEKLIDDAIARSPETAMVFELSDDEKDSVFMQSEHGKILQERLSALVAAFRARSDQAKKIVMQPPPEAPKPEPPPPAQKEEKDKPASKPEDKKVDAEPKKEEKKAPPAATPKKAIEAPPPVMIKIGKFSIKIPDTFFKIPRPPSFDPHSKRYLAWLTVVSVAFIYNSITIPYRAAFHDQNEDLWYLWLVIDYLCDAIYIVDLIIWKPSIKTFVNGIETSDKKEIVRKYILSETFRLDVICLLPLDLFYLIPQLGINPLMRLPRLLKIHAYWELLDRIDQIVTNPYYFRVLRSVAYMMYLIHANACLFYYLSYLQNFTSKDFFVYNNNQPECQNATTAPSGCTFPGKYSAYIFCFFFSVSMVTIIGNLNFPGEVWEMVYSTVLWFVGVFIFATLVGQIRDVLKAMTRQEDEFYEVMDAIVEHMHTLKIPKELQDRVRTWLLFNWEQQKTIDERRLLEGLPTKLRTDLAMEVHFSTVHKVQLFKDVDKKVLEELLLRLRPSVYLPGDYICKKGEIGKEMYIIKSGILEVVLPDGRVAVTLSPGSVFGEISLLALAGGNRRTADVRSKGFSNLYVLSKADLNAVMKDYPETLEALKQKAQELMNKGKPPPVKLDGDFPTAIEIIPTRPPTPEMVRVALNVLKPDSEIRRRISRSVIELSTLEDSDDDDPEVAIATIHHSQEERVQTPEPFHDVPTEASAGNVSNLDMDGAPSTSKIRRRRSQANAPSESSDSEADNKTQQLGSQNKIHRRKVSRLSNKSGRGSPQPKSGVSILKDVPPITATKTGSLTSLKRRLFHVPRIQPIEQDQQEKADSAVPGPSEARTRMFSFGPVPTETVAQIDLGSVTSFSDHEFADLTDPYAGVTFSSPDSP